MANSFFKSTRILLNYKRLLAMGLLGAIISAVCFGAGMSMVLPTLHVLLGGETEDESRKQLIEELQNPANPDYVKDTIDWLKDKQPEKAPPPLKQLIERKLMAQDRPQWLKNLGRGIIELLPDDELKTFISIMLIIGVMTVIGGSGKYMHGLFMITVISRAAMSWRAQMFRRLLHVPMAHMLKTGSADYISRINSDAQMLAGGYRALLLRTLPEALKGCAVLFAALLINWKLTAVAAVGVPVIGVLLRKFGKAIRRATRRALSNRGKLLGILKESLDGVHVVKVHNAEGAERRRFALINRRVFQEEMKVRRIRALSSPLIEALSVLGVLAVACISAWMIFREGEDAAEFITVLVMLGAAGRSLKLVSNINNQIAESSAAADRVFEVLNLPTEEAGIEESDKLPNLPRHKRDIHFDQVSFAYPDQDRPAVNDVDLRVKFGQMIAVVGGNGSGKTTLLSMLPRLLTPTVGCVRIDDTDIRDVNLRSLREQMGVVSQQSVLFTGTIAENIAYGRSHESLENIKNAAQAAFAHDFISALPGGYDTKLGEHGSGLSGGQRQRICIARAILRDPAILILDEATSQIDADSEAKISQAIGNLVHSRTIFVIAHRLSTVIEADQIVVLDNGSIVDVGTHEELLERNDLYRSLAQNQLVGSVS